MEVKESRGGMFLLPPRPGVCQICAHDHPPDAPHDAQSLYYQQRFYLEQGRWPTWKDAIKHCAPEVQAAWEAELRKRGAWTEPATLVPDAVPMPEAVLKNK